MLFNDYEIYQIAKLRQEEVERKAHDAWKYVDVKHESFFQKVFGKWNIPQKSVTVKKNCGCACQS